MLINCFPLPSGVFNNLLIQRFQFRLHTKKGINDPEFGGLCKKAIDEEPQIFISDRTCIDVVAPSHVNLVGTMWAFTIKYRADGKFDRFKARLVAPGFTKQSRIDYTEMFVRTVQMATMRIFLQIIAAEDLKCW